MGVEDNEGDDQGLTVDTNADDDEAPPAELEEEVMNPGGTIRQSKSMKSANSAVLKRTMTSVQRAASQRDQASQDSSYKKMAKKKYVHGGPPSRQHMIDYVNLQKWSRDSSFAAPFAICMWVAVVTLINWQNYESAFAVRQSMINHLHELKAVPVRGVPPKEVMVTKEGQIQTKLLDLGCSCSCALTASKLCNPTTDNTMTFFNGSLELGKLSDLRGRAAYYNTKKTATNDWVMRWDDLHSRENVISWIQHGLLPELWHEEGKDAPVILDNMFKVGKTASDVMAGFNPQIPGVLLEWSQMIGGLRMRQRRLHKQDCRVDAKLAKQYNQECHDPDVELVVPFGPGIGSFAEGFVPEEKVMGAYDVHYNIDTPLHTILENYEYMLKKHSWLDGATESLTIHVALVNAESSPPLFLLLEIIFKFERSGQLNKEIKVYSTAMNMFSTGIHVALALLWGALVLTLLALQSVKGYKIASARHHYSTIGIGFVLDWFTLFWSLLVVILYAIIFKDAEELTSLVAAMPKIPDIDSGAEAQALYVKTWTSLLDRAVTVTTWFDGFRVLLFWYTLVIGTQFVKIFRGQPKLAQLMATFSSAAEDLIHFALVFLTLFLNFAFGGFAIWGLVLEEWSTPVKAVVTTLRALMGDLSLEAMYDYAPFATTVWFSTFFCSIVMVMLNLLLALVYDHYTMVKGRSGVVSTMGTQIRFFIRDQMARLDGQTLKFKLTAWCRTNPSIPSHDKILEQIMDNAGLPASERAHIMHSVLGPQIALKARSTAIFAGTTTDKVLGADEQASPDLLWMDDMDPEYGDKLMAGCQGYMQVGYDPEDARTAQLRELVTIAEEDIFEMKFRLEQCAEYTRVSMHGLTRRINALEVLVHQALVELVAIAGESGVPMKSEYRPPAVPHKVSNMLQTTVGTFPSMTGTNKQSTGFGETGMALTASMAAARSGSVQKWHRAQRAVDMKEKRKGPGPAAKFYGPR